jgi:hypothetical protein
LSVRWQSLIERLLVIEAGLRELAASGRAPSAEELERWEDELNGAWELCTQSGAIWDACSALSYARDALMAVGKALREGNLAVQERMRELRRADEELDEVERRVKLFTGRPCRWGKQLGEARLRHTMLINDVAACVHALAQYLLGIAPERVEGRCFIAKGAEPEAVEVCREWDAFVERANRKRLYLPSDYAVLRGFVTDGRVQLHVGSAMGHLAEIDVKRRAVKYYDTDWYVNRLAARLLEEYAGGRCRMVDREEGGGVDRPSVECEGADPRRAARVLALTTSMDERLFEVARRATEEGTKVCVERELLGIFADKR